MKLLTYVSAIALSLVATNSYAQEERGPRGEPPAEFIAALQECAAKYDISIDRNSGDRPTPEQRNLIDSCLADKGFEKPERPRHSRRGPPPERSVSNSKGNASGQSVR